MRLGPFLREGAIRILLEIDKRGGTVQKCDLLGPGGPVRWATYIVYEKDFLRLGLIEGGKVKGCPRRKYISLTERGREVVGCLRHIERLVREPYDPKV